MRCVLECEHNPTWDVTASWQCHTCGYSWWPMPHKCWNPSILQGVRTPESQWYTQDCPWHLQLEMTNNDIIMILQTGFVVQIAKKCDVGQNFSFWYIWVMWQRCVLFLLHMKTRLFCQILSLFYLWVIPIPSVGIENTPIINPATTKFITTITPNQTNIKNSILWWGQIIFKPKHSAFLSPGCIIS